MTCETAQDYYWPETDPCPWLHPHYDPCDPAVIGYCSRDHREVEEVDCRECT
jgi:hypothetical protein